MTNKQKIYTYLYLIIKLKNFFIQCKEDGNNKSSSFSQIEGDLFY